MGSRRDELLDNLHRLVVFQRVAQARSFTRAAASLFVSQPAVSAHIRALEDALACRLFERTPRGVELTAAGRALLTHVNRGLQALRDGLAAVASDREPAPLAIGTVVSASLNLLPCILDRFRSRYPSLRITMRVGRSSEIARMVGDGTVHVGLVVTRPSQSGVGVRVLLEESVVCVGPPAHRLAGRRDVPVTELGRDLLLLAPWGEGFEVLVAALRDALGDRFAPAVEVDPADAAKQMALQGVGLTFLGESLVRDELEAGRLVRIPLAGLPPLVRRVYLLYPRRRRPAAVCAFVEVALQTAQSAGFGRADAATAGGRPTAEDRRGPRPGGPRTRR